MNSAADAALPQGLSEQIERGLAELALPADREQLVALAQFLRLLEKWNRAFNLSGARDRNDMVQRHLLDSLAVAPYLHGLCVLDVGTGAGFPGLPLAVLEPKRQFTLLDSVGKKIRFVRHAVGELGLTNVAIEQTRVENYAPADPFDTVTCRAFSSLGVFVRSCGRLTAAGGRLVAMKGRFPEDELAELTPDWQATQVAKLAVPGLEGQRHAVVVERSE